MIQAARAALFYAMLIGGALSLLSSDFAWGALLLVGAAAWSQWGMRYSDHDALASLLFFVFVLSMIASFLGAIFGFAAPY